MIKMVFDSKKVLPIDDKSYLDHSGKTLLSYDTVGIHGMDFDRFLEKVPVDAEVVVNYRAVGAGQYIYHYGLALVPRK